MDHAKIDKTFDDRKTRLPSGLTFTGILTSSGGLLDMIKLIKSFFSP